MFYNAPPKIAFSAIEAYVRKRNAPADKVAGRRAVPGAAATSSAPHDWVVSSTSDGLLQGGTQASKAGQRFETILLVRSLPAQRRSNEDLVLLPVDDVVARRRQDCRADRL